MQVNKLHKRFDVLQRQYGDTTLTPVYGAGCIERPNACFVFMNPTGRNVSSQKVWKGLKAPWIGTKNAWRLFSALDIFSKDLYEVIRQKKALDWDYNFSAKVYEEVKNNKIYITNLSKATQIDARPLKNNEFVEYIDLLKEEIATIKPKVVISFGNQVSSLLLDTNVQVSVQRRKSLPLEIQGNPHKVYPVYYPVGQGMRNIKKSISDIKWIMKNNKII